MRGIMRSIPFLKQRSLAARFNMITILMILITSFGITLFVIRQENAGSYEELVNRGTSVATIISKNSDYSIYTEDQKSLQQLADSTLTDQNVAYVAILNVEKRVLAAKTKSAAVRIPSRDKVKADQITTERVKSDKDGQEYIDILAPVVSVSSGDLAGLGQDADTGPKTIGYVQIGLTQEGLRNRIRTFLFSIVIFTSLLVAMGVVVTVFMTRRITSPVKKLALVARDISQGKLNHTIEKDGDDEIASLAVAIDDMASNLREMISKISTLAASVSRVTMDITESPASVLKVVDYQRKAIEETVLPISELDNSITAITNSSEILYQSAEETFAATTEMTTSVLAVSENASVFDKTAQEVASSVEEMISAINDIARSLEIIFASSGETSSSLFRVNTTISRINQNAEESVRLAEQVSAAASETGMTAVSSAIDGIELIRQRVGTLAAVINGLNKRSEEIGSILTVIDEVTDQTSLLALNAAILAAQAGQQGAAFSVVADEIKKLAERTAASTKEIADLIAAVQAETHESVKMVDEEIRAVDEGVRLVQEVRNVLQVIMDRSRASTDMSKAIQKSTVDESQVLTGITAALKQQVEQIELISRATGEQSKGSRLIGEAIEMIKNISHQLMTSTREQLEVSKQISVVSENVSAQAGHITAAIKSQKQKSNEIVMITDKIQKTTADLIASAGEMNKGILSLSKDAQTLISELRKFEV
jgi:methyl-accepting chemotaxis protein